MQLYDIGLFVHILGVIALFGGFIVHHRAGARLRAARTVDEAKAWFGLIDATAAMFPGGLLMLLASGIYMTVLRWQSMPPFIVVGAIGLLVLLIIGGTVAAGQTRAIKAVLADGQGTLTKTQQRVIANRTPWIIVAMLNGMALGLVFLMSTKPLWIVSLVSLLLPGMVGVFVGAFVLQRSPK